MDYMLTSGYNFEGYKITGYYGMVTAESLMGAALKNQSAKWDAVRNDVYASMTKKIPKEANAIIGIQTSHNHFQGSGMSSNFYFFATGTAVSVEKL